MNEVTSWPSFAPSNMAVDNNGGVYQTFTGYIYRVNTNAVGAQDTLYINGVNYTSLIEQYPNIIMKLNPNGQVAWVKAKNYGLYGIALDQNCNIFYATNSSLKDIYNDSFHQNDSTAGSYLIKSDSSGNPVWVGHIIVSHFLPNTYQIINYNGEIYLVYQEGEIDIANIFNTSLSMASFNSQGIENWNVTLASTGNAKNGCGISIVSGNTNNIYFSGWMDGYQKNYYPLDEQLQANKNNYAFLGMIDTATIRNGILRTTPLNNNLNIYPNPSHNTFNIQITGENLKEAEINLSDIVGNKVTTFSINNEKEFTLNASDYSLQKGVYILSISFGGSVYTGKLVVE